MREVRTDGNYDSDALSVETGLECLDISLAVQSEAVDVDINTIVERYGITGKMPDVVRVPQYGDYLDAPQDFASALRAVEAGMEMFMELPASIRAKFGNDPQQLFEFTERESDPAKIREMFGEAKVEKVEPPKVEAPK